MILLLIVLGLLILTFGFVVAFGAPYLPTLGPQVKSALQLADLKKGQTLIELGSGDGKVVVAAAEQGLKVVGYELNPVLVLISRLRTRKYGKQVRIIWGDFWKKDWPETDAIFVFLLPRLMTKLDKKVMQSTNKPVKLVSFAFHIPDRQSAAQKDGLYLYLYDNVG